MDNYLKQLENLISPRNFDIQFFRENKKDNSKEEILLSNDDNKKLIEEYLRKMKDSSMPNTQKLNNNIIVPSKESKNNIITQNIDLNPNNRKNSKYSLSPKRKLDQSNIQSSPVSNSIKNVSNINGTEDSELDQELRQKIHEMSIANMNYRHEVSSLKQNIEEIQKKIENQSMSIQKLEKQKDNDSKYLVKLENLIAQENKQKSNININLNVSNNSGIKLDPDLSRSQQFSHDYAGEMKNLQLNFNDKTEVREFIINLFNENQQLKTFQSQIQDISKNYDTVNENIVESMRSVQLIVDNISKSNALDNSQFNALIGKRCHLSSSL